MRAGSEDGGGESTRVWLEPLRTGESGVLELLELVILLSDEGVGGSDGGRLLLREIVAAVVFSKELIAGVLRVRTKRPLRPLESVSLR